MATMIGRRVWCSAITMHLATVLREVSEIGWEVEIDGWGKHVCGAHSIHMTDADAIRQLEEEEFCAQHTREQIERGELSIANAIAQGRDACGVSLAATGCSADEQEEK